MNGLPPGFVIGASVPGRRSSFFCDGAEDLIEHTEVNRNYQKSDLLQLIRILKNYDLFKEPQLELFKSRRKKR